MNTFKSTLLLVLLTLFLIFLGDRIGGRNGMLLAFILSVAFNFGTYFFSDKIALNVLPTESPNAFATGRNPQHASVAVTHGILQLLDEEELEGVLAHELGHVRNRDILTSSIAATLAGAITMVARMGYWASLFGGGGGGRGRERGGGGLGALLMIIVAPIAASLIQLWISRTREFEADATGAATTGNPYALARALQKLEDYSKRIPMQASPSNAHLFIVAPLLGSGGIGNLFSTHPPMKERIQRLIGRDHV